ncbi:MAG: ATP-binding cassette domain-containing protein [Duganella sp.]
MKHLFSSCPALRQLLLTQPARLLLGALLAALTTLAGIALLGLSGWFISATAIAGMHSATAFLFDVFAPSAGIRLLALGRTGARYAERLVTHDATFGALAALRVRLFRGWSLPDAASRLLRSPAKLLFRLTVDIDALESLYLRLLVPAATALFAALLAGVGIGLVQWQLGLATALWLLACGSAISCWLLRAALRPGIARARAVEALRSGAIDLVAGQTELLMAGQIERQRQVLARADHALARADLALLRLDVRAGAAFTIAASVTLCAVLLAAAVLVDTQALPVPLAALAILVALAAMEPFAGLRRGALEAGRLWLAMRRLGAPLEQGLAAAVPQQALDETDIGAIHLNQVSAAHGGARTPLLHVGDLHIGFGERVALIGASGAGKSTLLAVLAGELAPLQGSVQAQRACLFTQRTELFQDSLRDNLRLADPGASDERLWQALEDAGLAAEVRALRHGLDTLLGEGGLGLSGGQARRLALARLFLHHAPLWLLDEATEALDAATAHDVLRRLRAHANGRTVVIATHLQREAALADRLITVRDGGIAGDVRRGSSAFNAALDGLRTDSEPISSS